MSEETAPDSAPYPQPPVTGEVGEGDSPKPGGQGAVSDAGEGVIEDLPPRADRDRFGTLAKNVPNPDRTCLTCLVLVFGAILLLIGCGVYYYHANAAFHQP